MRVLVTGASGFIGSRLVPELIQRGHEVFCISRHDGESSRSETDIFWDLASRETPRELPDRIDGVAHLAQARRYRQFPDDAPEMFQVNVAGTAALLEYSRQAGANRPAESSHADFSTVIPTRSIALYKYPEGFHAATIGCVGKRRPSSSMRRLG